MVVWSIRSCYTLGAKEEKVFCYAQAKIMLMISQLAISSPEVSLYPLEVGSTDLRDAQACACVGTGPTGHAHAVAVAVQ